MTEVEQLRSEVRELKMRIRELRTENAELKIQQKRWLTLSTGVSVFSLVLALVMFMVSGDIKVERPANSGSQNVYSLDSNTNQNPQIKHSFEASEPVVDRSTKQQTEQEPTTNTFFDAPDLGLDIEAPDPTPPQPKPPVNNMEPSRGGAFELPGSNQGPKKKVIQYTVKKNDTLWDIARKMMGSSKSSNIRKIMKDNGLTDSRLDPGMSLVIIVDE